MGCLACWSWECPVRHCFIWDAGASPRLARCWKTPPTETLTKAEEKSHDEWVAQEDGTFPARCMAFMTGQQGMPEEYAQASHTLIQVGFRNTHTTKGYPGS